MTGINFASATVYCESLIEAVLLGGIMDVWTWLDWIIVAIFTFSTLLGFMRGLVSEIISIIVLIAAVFIAITFADSFAISIMNYSVVQALIVKTSSAFGGNTTDAISYIALALSFMILFTGTLLAGALFKLVVNFALQAGILGIGNRILGGFFGVVRGFLLNLVMLFLLQLTPLTAEAWWQQSYFVPYFQPSLNWLEAQVTPAIEQLKAKLEATDITGRVQDLISTVPSKLNR